MSLYRASSGLRSAQVCQARVVFCPFAVSASSESELRISTRNEMRDLINGRVEQHRDGKLAPITAWKDCIDRLIEGKVAKKLVAEPGDFIIHPQNLSGFGATAYDVHRVGKMFNQIGVDPSELEKAAAFERMPMDPMSAAQVAFNEKLISASKGMLAPLTCSERFCSVGAGHAAEFFKAARAVCSTSEPTLVDPSMGGKMNAETFLSQDPRFHSALRKGWLWAILPWQAEVTRPRLPDLAQRALDASNNVASLMTELEVRVSIDEFAELMPEGSSFSACVEAAKMNRPPCQAEGFRRLRMFCARRRRERGRGAQNIPRTPPTICFVIILPPPHPHHPPLRLPSVLRRMRPRSRLRLQKLQGVAH